MFWFINSFWSLIRYQRQVPGSVFLNESTGNQAQVPGGAFVDGA